MQKNNKPKNRGRFQSSQTSFDFFQRQSLKSFGGSLLKKSHSKVKRPIDTKKCIHVVLRSSLAKGRDSLLRRERAIQKIISKNGKKFGVKVYRQANAGNHLHLVVLPRSRRAFHGFLRAVSGIIARLILQVERGRAKKIKFWDQRPFTRILEWGKELTVVKNYLLLNSLEAWGFIPYTPRKLLGGKIPLARS